MSCCNCEDGREADALKRMGYSQRARLGERLLSLLGPGLAKTDDLVASTRVAIGPEIPRLGLVGTSGWVCGCRCRGLDRYRHHRRRRRHDGGCRCTCADEDQRDGTAKKLLGQTEPLSPCKTSSGRCCGARKRWGRPVAGPAWTLRVDDDGAAGSVSSLRRRLGPARREPPGGSVRPPAGAGRFRRRSSRTPAGY